VQYKLLLSSISLSSSRKIIHPPGECIKYAASYGIAIVIAGPACRLVRTEKGTERREREELDTTRKGFNFLYRNIIKK
jgi:hypothetical protein